MSMEELLSSHTKLGWDFDGCVYDHPAAAEMHRYIMEHPEKHHFIVTFRSHGWQHEVFDDLESRHAVSPREQHFDGILSVPNEIFQRFWEADRRRKQGLPFDPADVTNYVEWKGKICAQHGITVLVDDMPHHVKPGCDLYGVLHIHPDEF